jgi:hypothetical protein
MDILIVWEGVWQPVLVGLQIHTKILKNPGCVSMVIQPGGEVKKSRGPKVVWGGGGGVWGG